MPKKRTRGRRGGGTSGRRTVEVTTSESEETEMSSGLNISLTSDDKQELEQADESLNQSTAMEVPSQEELGVAVQISDAGTILDSKNGIAAEEEHQSKQDGQGESSETVALRDLCTDKPDNIEEKEQVHSETTDLHDTVHTVGLEGDSIQSTGPGDGAFLAVLENYNKESEMTITKELEEELLEIPEGGDDKECTAAQVYFADNEADGDQKEEEEVQYIDEEADGEPQVPGAVESEPSCKTDATQDSGPFTENDTTEQKEDLPSKDSSGMSNDLLNLSAVESQETAELENSKFEEISEGSIDEGHEELAVEPVSDVEIVGEYSVSKETYGKKGIATRKRKTKIQYKGAETLEEVFFATENDDVKITAEDKDNDDISDASLSDHADANLSLEEISDEDLEPSRKRRKSTGQGSVKMGKYEKVDENLVLSAEMATRSDEKSEAVTESQTSATALKRTASTGSADGSVTKKLKQSEETAKGNEETSRSENDPAFSVADTKKEGKKPQAKDVDASHNKNVLPRRNLSHSSRSEQQQGNREKPLPSRSRYEMVNFSCQTEPRQLKGKIVQCNINPLKYSIGSGALGSRSTLLSKFRKQLPSSIPEQIFAEITSLQPAQKENTYSFSMGPVTLSDMDSPQFREVVLRSSQNFSLSFDEHSHGIFKATLSKHESLASLISHLKCLELGNRYMVMSVVYACRTGQSTGVWKATLIFMYEQDMHLEGQSHSSDGKVRAKLVLKGVPRDVSKDFIQLLFPEVVSVSTDTRAAEERVVTLGFSSAKTVKDILTCYDLLAIGGSQVFISPLDTSEDRKSTHVLPDVGEELNAFNPVSTKLEEAQQDSSSKPCEQNSGIKQEEPDISRFNQENEDSQNVMRISEGLAHTQDIHEKEDIKAGLTLLGSVGSDQVITETVMEMNVPEAVNAQDLSGEDLLGNAEENRNNSASELSKTDALNVSVKEKDKAENTTEVIIARDTEGLADRDGTDTESLSSSKPQDEAARSPCKLQDEAARSSSVLAGELIIKQEANDKDVADPDTELLQNSFTSSSKSMVDISTKLDKDGAEGEKQEETLENTDGRNTEKRVDATEKSASNDENLEDVSDEEMVNQSRHGDHEDVVIVREDSSKWPAVHIDLTRDELDASVKVLGEKDSNVDRDLQPPGRVCEGRVEAASNDSVAKNVSPKLVITDGDLEVSLEVIDVNEGDKEMEKVIYPRTWRRSRDRSHDRSVWDSAHYKSSAYTHTSMKDNHWSHSSRSGAYYISRDPYKHYSARDDVSRMSRRNHSGSSREGSPHFRAPAREATAQRRDSLHQKHRSHRNHSSSPKRDSRDPHKHSSSHTSDHRADFGEHWDKRRYGAYGDSKRAETLSRPAAEYGGRQGHWPSHRSVYHTSYHSHEDQHTSFRSKDHYSHGSSRDPYVSDRRHGYRKSRSQSFSDMSITSSEDLSPQPARKSSYKKESPRRPVFRTSRSPISVLSRSHSLSPVSKSPSIDCSRSDAGKEELVKTVQHFLQLAKGIQQAQKRRSNRSRSSKSPPSRISTKSPLRGRFGSPLVPGEPVRKTVRSSRLSGSRSPYRIRSRSPQPSWSKNSRSPSFSRSKKYKSERSQSPDSPEESHRKHYKSSNRRDSYHRGSESPKHYESKRYQRPGEGSQTLEERGSRLKSGQWSEPKHFDKYKSSTDQSWQQSFGDYQSSGPVYNPSYPPPGCPPQQQGGMFSSSSVPAYQYNNPSQYSYSGAPPYGQSGPPPASVSQSYQPAYSVYQSSQVYGSAGPHNQPPHANASGQLGSYNSSSKNKSWPTGGTSFQRAPGKDSRGDKKGKSGMIEKIEDRERLERPKYSKPERVLTTVQMQKK